MKHEDWMIQAEEGLDTAITLLGAGKYFATAYYSQQASEKALKSLLIFLGRDPGKTHSLTELADIIEKEGLEVPSNVKENLTFSGVKGAEVPLRE